MVRDANLSTVEYVPDQLPEDPKELVRALQNELAKIQTAIRGLADGHSDVSYVPPTKPRDGDERYADGVSWNPGSGRGKYLYKVDTWVFLG